MQWQEGEKQEILEIFEHRQYNYVETVHAPLVFIFFSFLFEGKAERGSWQSRCFLYGCKGKKGGGKAGNVLRAA